MQLHTNLQFCWSREAQQAFEQLKQAFTSASVLTHLDHALPFVVEMDVSSITISAVLSQQ